MKAIIIILLGFSVVACNKYVENEINLESSFSLQVIDTLNKRANGISLVTLQLSKQLKNENDTISNATVTFSTNKGSIINSIVPLYKKPSIAFLRVAQDTGFYVTKAQVKQVDKILTEKTIVFQLIPAFADTIYLEPDRATYNFSNDKQVNITTYLVRKEGVVTKGRTVSFSAYQFGKTTKDTIKVGRFTNLYNNASDAIGKLEKSIAFYTDTKDIDTNKVVEIKALSRNDLSRFVISKIQLRYNK